MTVAELIEKLQSLPPNLEVVFDDEFELCPVDEVGELQARAVLWTDS